MRKNTPNKVLLDANVIYSSAIRDILLNLAQANLFEPKWSAKIHEEWTKNLLFKRSDLSKSKVERVVQNMNRAFENANVEDYFDLIPNLQLPDPDDRHVLAAAIKGKAKIITTANLKDFPQDYIRQFGIEVQFKKSTTKSRGSFR